MRSLPVACLLWIALTASAWAASALDYTRTTLEEARTIVASAHTHNEKLQALSSLFKNFLDTNEMGRLALGEHWASFTPAQRKEFLVLFGRLLERTYVQKLLLFENPNFTYGGETPVDGETRVDTSIVTPRDDFAVVYLLRSDGARWLATSIQVENVSLTANLGSQLDRLLSKSSVDDVLDLMRRKYGDGVTNQ
ncbi:MAG: phospholipid-binding protein MlaC [Candidatus Binataceae bacterium]